MSHRSCVGLLVFPASAAPCTWLLDTCRLIGFLFHDAFYIFLCRQAGPAQLPVCMKPRRWRPGIVLVKYSRNRPGFQYSSLQERHLARIGATSLLPARRTNVGLCTALRQQSGFSRSWRAELQIGSLHHVILICKVTRPRSSVSGCSEFLF